MRYLQELRKRELMSLAGDCHMELRVLDVLVTAGVGHEIPLKGFSRIIITKGEHVEVYLVTLSADDIPQHEK